MSTDKRRKGNDIRERDFMKLMIFKRKKKRKKRGTDYISSFR